jgi:hypothetical protein
VGAIFVNDICSLPFWALNVQSIFLGKAVSIYNRGVCSADPVEVAISFM